MTEKPGAGPGLARTIGTFGLAASVVNVIIGSSIFVFPATVAAALGPSGILAYVIAAVLMGLIALCFAESGSRVTGTGGLYAYVGAAFGPFAGWLVGLLVYLGVQLVASAVVGSVFVRSMSAIFPILSGGVPRAAVLVAIYAIFATVNIRGGARLGVKVVEGVTAAKLLPLFLVIGLGLFFFRAEFVTWDAMPPLADLGRMAMRLIYLVAGIEAVLAVSGEVKDPSRTIPRGLLLGLGTCMLIYLGVQFASQGLLGPELATRTQAPLADAAAVVLGTPGRTILLLGAAISTLGYLSADMLASPRSIYAMAEAGRIPKLFGRVHPQFGSPAIAIVAHAAAACLLAITGDFDTLTSLSSSALMLIYLLSCTATIVLQRRKVGEDLGPLKLPGGPVIPLLALAIVVALMTTLKQNEVIAVLVVTALAAATYAVSRRPQKP